MVDKLFMGKSNIIKLDYDDISWQELKDRSTRNTEILKFMCLDKYVNTVKESLSKSRKGYHIEIELKTELYNWQIVCLQTMMQSDWKREAFNLLRISNGNDLDTKWNILFASDS